MTTRAFGLLGFLAVLILALASGAARANPPCGKTTTGNCIDGSGSIDSQRQGQTQGQGQSQSAQGGNAAGGTGYGGSVGNTSAQSAASAAASVGSTTSGNTQGTAVSTYNAGLAMGTQIISGCGVSGQAGGSNVHGAAMLGVGFTTSECYAYIEAQAFHAIGDEYDACLVLHSTDAARRTEKRLGHSLGSCTPPAPVVIERMPPGVWYSEDELQARIAAAVHAMAPCPTPVPAKHHVHAKPSVVCKMWGRQ